MFVNVVVTSVALNANRNWEVNCLSLKKVNSLQCITH